MNITPRDSLEPLATPVHYEAGFIVLSYFISLVGCISTLELLQRRTSCRGAFNWYLLIASSFTMGGVGIWSMHFVGNRAIILANGASDRQLLYNQAYTSLSFFLPIIVVLVAFYLLAVTGKATKLNILLAGLLTGTAVCAMHYVGQVGIANYDCNYRVGNIVGAAIIAVTASLIALSVFFRLRDTWTDSWWKRSFCGAVLAGAVSGMHWTAAVGTEYHFRMDSMGRAGQTRVQTVIFCAVLSFAACVFLLSVAILQRRRALRHRKRAQELVLACVYFDENDQVMVSHDGFLPYQKITNQFVRKTFGEDELNRSHPAFMWVYEASRNWPTLRDFVPGMQFQLDQDPIARRYQPGHEDSVDLSRSASADFLIIFKQLFCVAAERLATQISGSLEDLGVMFEEPLETGTTKHIKKLGARSKEPGQNDVENSRIPRFLGKGRYLFLNRRLTKSEAADFAAKGYRFGSIFHVADSLAQKMQVDHESMRMRLERMKICISREHLHPAGIHLACFLLRPNVHSGFDILVPTVSQNQLPLMTLPIKELKPSHQSILQSFNEWTVRDILRELISEENNNIRSEKDFRWQLHSTLVRLVDMINDSGLMMEARFSARPVRSPCRSTEGLNSPGTCLLFSIRYLGSIHSSYAQDALTYVPLDFFGAQQLVETSSARQESFKRKTQIEFRTCLEEIRRSYSEPRSVESQDDTAPGLKTPPRKNSSILSKFGVSSKPKRSRHNSRSKILSSGRTTAEPEPDNMEPTTVSKHDLGVLTKEIVELDLVDASSPSSATSQQAAHTTNADEIERTASADAKEKKCDQLKDELYWEPHTSQWFERFPSALLYALMYHDRLLEVFGPGIYGWGLAEGTIGITVGLYGLTPLSEVAEPDPS